MLGVMVGLICLAPDQSEQLELSASLNSFQSISKSDQVLGQLSRQQQWKPDKTSPLGSSGARHRPILVNSHLVACQICVGSEPMQITAKVDPPTQLQIKLYNGEDTTSSLTPWGERQEVKGVGLEKRRND